MVSSPYDSDPLIQRLLIPVLTKCWAVAGFDSTAMESVLLPLLSVPSASYLLALFHLIDTPAGLVQNFEKIIRKFIDSIESGLIRTNPR